MTTSASRPPVVNVTAGRLSVMFAWKDTGAWIASTNVVVIVAQAAVTRTVASVRFARKVTGGPTAVTRVPEIARTDSVIF